MMIRSAPPASASFAESPVPAPAPMIGLPASTWARRRASASSRVTRAASDQLVQAVGHRDGERRVVDLLVAARAPRPRRRASRRARRAAPRRRPRRGTAGRARRSSRRRRAGRTARSGPCAAVSLRPISPAQLARTRRASSASASPSGCGRRGCGPRTAAGTVSRGPKLTMSSAPSETTWGTPAAPAASSRSGPAESTPPTSSSASSVVVASSTPARKPPRTSASIDWPPAPVAWKTSTS